MDRVEDVLDERDIKLRLFDDQQSRQSFSSAPMPMQDIDAGDESDTSKNRYLVMTCEDSPGGRWALLLQVLN